MDSQATDLKDRRFDEAVLRTFALLVGVVLVAIGLGVLMNRLMSNEVTLASVATDAAMIASIVAFAVGMFLLYWGVRRPRSKSAATEESLSRLVDKYEREGKTLELEDAREQLIQLLIEKDEKDAAQGP
jgi:protein-S-isoprenylcysteine O-methyltransferase Ste14